MKNKNQNFKFNKKSPKSAKLSQNNNDKPANDYSKIICEVLEKNKEESKNGELNNIKKTNNQIINFNNTNTKYKQISNKLQKNIIKIELNSSIKITKNNLKEESIKDKKSKLFTNKYNTNSIIKQDKIIFQSNSEKNIAKEKINEVGLKRNICINKLNNSNLNSTSLNKSKKININITNLNDSNFLRKQKSYNNKREADKSTEIKMKKAEELKEKAINFQYNIKEIFGNKKSFEANKRLSQNNININEFKGNNNSNNKKNTFNKKIRNKNLNINENINNSPDKIIIKINNVGNHNIGKIKNMQKKNTNSNKIGMNLNDIEAKKIKLFKRKKKYILNNNKDNSPHSLNMKSSNLTSKNKYIINIKNSNNSNKNIFNSKINYSTNQNSNLRGIKVESINIDLNANNKKYINNSNSHKKNEKNISLTDKNNLSLRETEISKFSTKFNLLHPKMELSLIRPNESNELNHSFKTSFILAKKARSLSKKRDERKKMNLFKFEGIVEEENDKKINDILLNLSQQKENEFAYGNIGQKDEPKNLIDKIRKVKKMKKINNIK